MSQELAMYFNMFSSLKDLNIDILEVNRPVFPKTSDSYEDVPGRNGSYLFPGWVTDQIITVRAMLIDATRATVRTRLRTVAAKLRSEDYAQLSFDDEPNVYYMAKVSEQVPLTADGKEFGEFVIYFHCLPLAFEVTEQVTTLESQSGANTATVTNNGTYESIPVIEIEGRSSSVFAGAFNRPSPAYNQSGAQVASGLPRYENGYFHNLLTDNQASVETDATGFTVLGTPTVSRITTEHWTGSAALRVQTNTDGHGINVSNGVRAAGAYIFSVYLKGTGTVYISIYDGTTLVSVTGIVLTSTWTRYSITGIMANATIYGYVRQNGAGTADIYCDGLQIEEGSVAKPWILPSQGKGIYIEEGTTNLLTANQSDVETDTTGFEQMGTATLTRVTSEYWRGSACIRSQSSSSGHGFRVNNGVQAAGVYTWSVYLKGTGTVKIQLYDGTATVQQTNITLTSNWTRYTITGTMLNATVYGYVVQDGVGTADVYCDGLQLEQKSYATSWQIGGTARAAETLSLPTAGVLTPTQGTWEQMTYFTPSMKRTANYPFVIYIPRFAGASSGGIWFTHSNNSAEWKLNTQNDSVVTTSALFAESLISDGWHRLGITWNMTAVKIFVDGVLITTINNPALPSAFHSVAYVGSYNSGDYYSNTTHDDLCISSIARTDAEMQSRGVSTSPLPVDNYTTAKMTADGNLNITGITTGVPGAVETKTTNPSISLNGKAFNWTGTLNHNEKLTIDSDKLTVLRGTTNEIANSNTVNMPLKLAVGANTLTYSDTGSNRGKVTVKHRGRWL